MNVYYEIRAGETQRYAELTSPVSVDGEFFPNASGRVAPDLAYCKFMDSRRTLADCLDASGHLVFTATVLQALRQFSCQSDMLFVPVIIRDGNGRLPGEFYTPYFPTRIMDAVNLSLSVFTTYPDGTPMHFRGAPVLRSAALTADFMYLQYVHHACSARMKDAIEGRMFSNVEFIPHEVVQ
jgi:hypothetical protein